MMKIYRKEPLFQWGRVRFTDAGKAAVMESWRARSDAAFEKAGIPGWDCDFPGPDAEGGGSVPGSVPEDSFRAFRDTPHPVVTLVGSSKFGEDFREVAANLHRRGCQVLTMHVFGHHEGMDMAGPEKRMLDAAYLDKIRRSDAVLVVAPGGYVGLGAMDEILYAMSLGKPVLFREIPACADGLREIFRLETEKAAEFGRIRIPAGTGHLDGFSLVPKEE